MFPRQLQLQKRRIIKYISIPTIRYNQIKSSIPRGNDNYRPLDNIRPIEVGEIPSPSQRQETRHEIRPCRIPKCLNIYQQYQLLGWLRVKDPIQRAVRFAAVGVPRVIAVEDANNGVDVE